MSRNFGLCNWWCGQLATNACHRLPEGQGGPYTAANLLAGCGSGTTGCHARTEAHRDLSYRAGWLIRQDTNPAERAARILRTPALAATRLGVGWFFLGVEVPDYPGVARATPEQVEAAGLDPSLTFHAAIRELRRLTKGWST